MITAAGERTPDVSPGDHSSGGSTDNDISLREHMQRQLDTQRYYFERIVAEQRVQLDERTLTVGNELVSDLLGRRYGTADNRPAPRMHRPSSDHAGKRSFWP